MRDVVFLLPAINPYWAERLNALYATGSVDFECWFICRKGEGRSWTVDSASLDFPHTFLSGNSWAKLAEMARLYRAANPRRILTFHFDQRLWPSILHRIVGRELAFYCEMTWDSWQPRSKVKEVAKHLLFRLASTVLTPGPDAEHYVQKYGARRVGRLNHVVDTRRFNTIARSVEAKSKTIRLLYLGRFIEQKGISFLVCLLEKLTEADCDYHMTFMGDGELLSALQEVENRADGRVRISGFRQTHQVPEVLRHHDLLLFPTTGDPYGLVVDEAMACGLSVISSPHAGEINWRLKDRGSVICLSSYDQWLKEIQHFASNRDDLGRHSSSSASFMEERGLELWVSDIERWVHAS